MGPFIEQVTYGLTELIPTVMEIGVSIQQIFGVMIPIALTQGAGAWTLISTTIQTVITSAIAILQTWLPVVQTVLAGIAAFLTAHGAEIQLLVSTAWNAVTTIIQTAISTVTVVINALAPVVLAIFGQISTFLNAHGSEILGFLTTSWNSISAIVGVAAELVQTVVTRVFGAVAGFIQAHGDTIQRVLIGAWNVISTLIGTALDTIKSVISLALAVVNGDWETAWSEIKNITDTANRLIGVIVSTAMDLITGVISSAVSVFQLSWSQGLETMRTIAITAWDAIKLAINDAIESAKTTIANGVEAFLGKFRDLRDKMSVIGQQLLEGMVQGIRDKVGWLVDEGVRAANAVLSAIKNTLGIKSPSKVMAEMGKYSMLGLANGIDSYAGTAYSAALSAANDIAGIAAPMMGVNGGAAYAQSFGRSAGPVLAGAGNQNVINISFSINGNADRAMVEGGIFDGLKRAGVNLGYG
jgi:phage-related protein